MDVLKQMLNKQIKKQTNSVAEGKPNKKRPHGPVKNFWHEVAIPLEYYGRFKGVSIGYDKRPKTKGYFVFTHRARSKSYTSIAKIPNSIIKRIEETG